MCFVFVLLFWELLLPLLVVVLTLRFVIMVKVLFAGAASVSVVLLAFNYCAGVICVAVCCCVVAGAVVGIVCEVGCCGGCAVLMLLVVFIVWLIVCLVW